MKTSVMKGLLCLCILLYCSAVLMAQGGYTTGLSSEGIQAYGSGPSAFSFLCNTASLAHYEKPELSVFSERRFLVKELQNFSAAGAAMVAGGWTGIAFSYSGFERYRSMEAEAAYAKKLGRVSLGLGFTYQSERAAGYGGSQSFAAQTGMLVQITSQLRLGFQVSNTPSTTGKTSRQPVLYRTGIGYMASGDFLLGFEIMKSENLPVDIHAGFSYNYKKRFFIGAGTYSATGSFYAGGGWSLKDMQLHVSVSHHPYLGFSPAVLINKKF